jgi:ketosteroid isomerase-like protein
LLDRRAIEDVVVEYARAVDARDWAALAGCFTDDCVVDYALSGRATGPDEVVALCLTAVEPLDVTQHYVSNVMAAVDGDTAESVCSLAAQLADRSKPRMIPLSMTRKAPKERLVVAP